MKNKFAIAIALVLASGSVVYAGSQSDSSAVSGAEFGAGDMHSGHRQDRALGEMRRDEHKADSRTMVSGSKKAAGEDTNASGGGNLSGATESMSDRSPES